MSYPPVPDSLRDRDDLELSEVSLISHDHDREDGKMDMDPEGQDYSSGSDQEDNIKSSERRRRALCISGLLCTALVVFAIAAASMSSQGQSSDDSWETAGAWGGPTEVFEALGPGLCLNIRRELLHRLPADATKDAELGLFSPAAVLSNGSSRDCQQRCAAMPSCTGFATFNGQLPGGEQGGCSLVTEADGWPAAGDGSSSYHCFWRHKFKYNSVGIYDSHPPAIPKTIWSYWEEKPLTSPSNLTLATRDFLALCCESWRKLNPGWQIRILNQDTVWNYIAPSDLPAGFKDLKIQHRSDLIRLSLLVKHGGVWLDASAMLLKPLSSWAARPDVRTFYVNEGMPGRPMINSTRYAENRYSVTFHIENWFYAAPPEDPLMTRTLNCVKTVHEAGEIHHLEDLQWIFSPRQIGDMHALGLWAYLTTDACMFKMLDEDLALYRWWRSPAVEVISWLGHYDPAWFAHNGEPAYIGLFRSVNPEMVNVLTADSNLLKLTGPFRDSLLNATTPKELHGCIDNSWSITLTSIQIFNASKCTELDMPGKNRWQ